MSQVKKKAGPWWYVRFEKKISIWLLKLEFETWRGMGLFVFVLLCAYLMYKMWWQPSERGDIQIFLPDCAYKNDGAFYQDGCIQMEGFEQADYREAEGQLSNRLRVQYQAMKAEEDGDSIVRRMRQLYLDKGSRFFLITMSRKALAVRDRFREWREEFSKGDKRAPVLIITVASASGLADSAHGILRWYVRSEEESALLAEYTRWSLRMDKATVFYITSTVGQADDTYGSRGMQVFTKRFMGLGGAEPLTIPVTSKSASLEVDRFMGELGVSNSAGRAVFVIGYGEMVSGVISRLIALGYNGPIVCTSTLTEPEWQPKDKSHDANIFTVMPRLAKSPVERLEGNDKNVVFFFAKRTLCRIFSLTRDNPDYQTFYGRWIEGTTAPELVEDYLADGDAMIQVDVVGSERWRPRGP